MKNFKYVNHLGKTVQNGILYYLINIFKKQFHNLIQSIQFHIEYLQMTL